MLTQSENGFGVAAIVSAALTAVMGWFDYYAAGIGAIFTILTFFTWLYFQFKNERKLDLSEENRQGLKDLKADIKCILDQLEKIK